MRRDVAYMTAGLHCFVAPMDGATGHMALIIRETLWFLKYVESCSVNQISPNNIHHSD